MEVSDRLNDPAALLSAKTLRTRLRGSQENFGFFSRIFFFHAGNQHATKDKVTKYLIFLDLLPNFRKDSIGIPNQNSHCLLSYCMHLYNLLCCTSIRISVSVAFRFNSFQEERKNKTKFTKLPARKGKWEEVVCCQAAALRRQKQV